MMNAIAMLLAGGEGSRLLTLSRHRAKPAVPFGGIYRIIDFTLSCIMRSNIPLVGILTQYRPYSLMDHISNGESWGFVGRRRLAKVLPPYVGGKNSDWYAGTADAVYQNLSFIERFPHAELILVLSGDHVYSMDYREVIEKHLSSDADLTVACQEVPWEETRQFGIMLTGENDRITGFIEKPKENPPSNLASLGIYVFRRKALVDRLRADAARTDSQHDFGGNIIPEIISEGKTYAYRFNGYWRDVGTVDSYWRAHMDILAPDSQLNLAKWQVQTNPASFGDGNLFPARVEPAGKVVDSILGLGSVITGTVLHSLLSPGVRVQAGAVVSNSVILHDTVVYPGAQINNAVIDKNVSIGEGAIIGEGDDMPNHLLPDRLFTGLTLIGKRAEIPAHARIGRNVLIESSMKAHDFPAGGVVPSGATVKY
ncbi:MAG: sugar phosphate nucleotidyltransferase [Candidatus Sumerlaeota bacterium]|nr:sugar phosphate nucleotidyltransferase [Candidatus Sumerlaeota bacterium]